MENKGQKLLGLMFVKQKLKVDWESLTYKPKLRHYF
jgi:hypothetical protein